MEHIGLELPVHERAVEASGGPDQGGRADGLGHLRGVGVWDERDLWIDVEHEGRSALEVHVEPRF